MDDFIDELCHSLYLAKCKAVKLENTELYNLYNELGELLLEAKSFEETSDYILNVLWKG